MPTYLSPGVYVEEVESGSRPIEGVGTAVAAFVGIAADGPFHTPTLVSSWTQFTSLFGEFVAGSYLAHAAYGYFLNGGGNCYIVRIGEPPSANGANGARKQAGGADRQAALTASTPQAEVGRLRILAADPATRSGEITVDVTEAGGESPGDDMFKLVIKRDGQQVEEFDRAVLGKGRQNVVTMVNTTSKVIRVEEVPHVSAQRPDFGTVELASPTASLPVPLPRLSTDDYVGDVAQRTGFGGLEAIEEVTMVCVPDLMSAYQQGAVDLETVQAVQLGMIAHCELMGDRVAILDPPPGLNVQQVKEWRMDKARYDSKYAALYWPWIKVADPATGGMIHVPPSGHMAGIWGRNDDTRGVHKAPANEVVRGAVNLELQITKNEHALLNPTGINCLRAFSGAGLRVFGARTLSSDPAWRYLNVRRLFNYLEESILGGTQWVVFEPNDRMLWARIRRTISAFLVNEWRKGALFGSTPDEAFYVVCDDTTNTAESIDAGQVICQIGVAPVKPAEFVVFRLAQFSGGTSLVSE
jgi:phage tail sheath protein FI